ncbi:MAG TPA: hypothetical protein VFQ50_04380 [Flavobacterium sp.]|jgi:hypothetical protein|nr:hypothetical protein [Flavobacterium sp.]
MGHHNNNNQGNNSHSRNPNIRDNTRDKQYKEHDETLTNDALYDNDTQELKPGVDAEFDDKTQNVENNQSRNG